MIVIRGQSIKWSAVHTDNNFHFMDMSTGFRFTLFELEQAVGTKVRRRLVEATADVRRYEMELSAFLAWIEKEWA